MCALSETILHLPGLWQNLGKGEGGEPGSSCWEELARESPKAGQRPHNSTSFIDIRKQANLELAVRNQQSHDIWGTLEHLASPGESRGGKWLTRFQ